MAKEGVVPLEATAEGATQRAGARGESEPPRQPATGRQPAKAKAHPEEHGVDHEQLLADLERSQAALEASTAAQAAALAELGDVRAELRTVREQRDTFDAERRGLSRRVAALEKQGPRIRTLDVPAVLRARGLPETVHAEALAALLRAEPAATLGALGGSEPEALRRLLDQRLVATCGDGPCGQVDATLAWIKVDPGDCEVCGGRQAGAALVRLQAACARRSITRIVVVGGSPNSRRALRDLAQNSSLRITTFDGTTAPAARRIKRIEGTTDLIVIWAGTILDHATSAAFQHLDRPTETIPYRGLERMLDALAQRLERWG